MFGAGTVSMALKLKPDPFVELLCSVQVFGPNHDQIHVRSGHCGFRRFFRVFSPFIGCSSAGSESSAGGAAPVVDTRLIAAAALSGSTISTEASFASST